MKETSVISNLDISFLYKQLTSVDSLMIYLWTFVCLFIAYASELGQFGFSSDYYYVLLKTHPPTSYSDDGRFLAEFIRFYILDGALPPTLLLIIGVSLLVITANIIAVSWGCNGVLVRVLAGLLLATFPFFYEVFSYVNMRHVVPLGIFLSVLGVITGGFHKGYSAKIKGFVFLYLSLFLYQVSINCAAVIVFIWGAMVLYETNNPREVLEKIIVPKLSMIIVSVLAYKLTLSLVDIMGAGSAARFGTFSNYPQNLDQIVHVVSKHLKAMSEFFYKGSFLFPEKAKIISMLVLYIFIFINLKRFIKYNKYYQFLFVVLLVFGAIVSTHGLLIPFSPAAKFLYSRMLVGYSLFGLGVFLLTAKFCDKGLHKIVIAMTSVVVMIYIIQANVWHQYLLMKNQADLDVTQQITHRLKGDAAYTPNLPLVIVGTMDADEYRYKKAFMPPTSLIKTSIYKSVYSNNWSKDRLIKFYMPFKRPNKKQIEKANKYSLAHNSWPHPESVVIRDGVMVVVLGANK